jgi:hypothetical protein
VKRALVIAISSAILALNSISSPAQEAPQQDPVLFAVQQEWGAVQLEQNHLLQSFNGLIVAYQQLKNESAAKDKYWAAYVAGINASAAANGKK